MLKIISRKRRRRPAEQISIKHKTQLDLALEEVNHENRWTFSLILRTECQLVPIGGDDYGTPLRLVT